jgi:hypothetical protein
MFDFAHSNVQKKLPVVALSLLTILISLLHRGFPTILRVNKETDINVEFLSNT